MLKSVGMPSIEDRLLKAKHSVLHERNASLFYFSFRAFERRWSRTLFVWDHLEYQL